MQGNSVSIFPRKLELFWLVFSQLLLLACLLFPFLTPVPKPEWNWLRFIMSYLFFDVTHHIFSFATLLLLPEGRRFLMADFAHRKFRYILAAAVLFALIAWKSTELQVIELPPIAVQAGSAFVIFLWARHSLGQTFGIGLLYSHAAKRSASEIEKAKIFLMERRERILFKLFIFIGIFTRFNSRAQFFKSSTMVDVIISLALTVLAVWIIGLTFCLSSPLFLRKRLFLTRLFIYPLVIWSPLAGLTLGSMHGSEYLLLSASIASRSSSKWAKYLPYFLTVVGILLIIPVFTVMYSRPALEMFGSWTQVRKSYLVPLIVFFFTLENFHYYVDSFIYRVKDESVREHLFPLMLPRNVSGGKREV